MNTFYGDMYNNNRSSPFGADEIDSRERFQGATTSAIAHGRIFRNVRRFRERVRISMATIYGSRYEYERRTVLRFPIATVFEESLKLNTYSPLVV